MMPQTSLLVGGNAVLKKSRENVEVLCFRACSLDFLAHYLLHFYVSDNIVCLSVESADLCLRVQVKRQKKCDEER